MDFLRLIARVIGRPLDSCQREFLILHFTFSLVEIGVKLAHPVSETYRFTEER